MGLKPWEFDRLTVHEFDSMLEAAKLQEARVITMCARAVALLLRPYMDKDASIEWTVTGWLGKDLEAEVLAKRAARLAERRSNGSNDGLDNR